MKTKDVLNNRLEKAEEWVSEIEMISSEKRRKKLKKKHVSNLWNNVKQTIIHAFGVQGDKRGSCKYICI